MEAFSMDLRKRVVEAYDAGRGSSRELARVFGVSSAWVRKLLRLRRETGSVAAKLYRRGPRPRLDERQVARLAGLVREHPDATLAELRHRLRVNCSLVTIH
jgi:transposase